jgi:hypothetical protein
MSGPLNLDRFASIAAELAQSSSRDEVLAREGVSLEVWLETQELWMTRMASEARRGRYALSQRYGVLYAEHRTHMAEGRKAAASSPVAPPRRYIAPQGAALAPIPLAAAPSGPYVTRLSVQQLAALRAELTVTPEKDHPQVRERFGLTEATWSLEETHWQKELKDPAIFAKYLHVFKYYRGLLQPGSPNG